MTKLQALKQLRETTIYPDDIIMAVLSQLTNEYISKDPAKIHRAVYSLTQKEEYKSLLSKFDFDDSGLTPFSDLLDRVLFRLETSCVLNTLNPNYERYALAADRKEELFRNAYCKFPEGTKPVITQMSKEFEAVLCN